MKRKTASEKEKKRICRLSQELFQSLTTFNRSSLLPVKKKKKTTKKVKVKIIEYKYSVSIQLFFFFFFLFCPSMSDVDL